MEYKIQFSIFLQNRIERLTFGAHASTVNTVYAVRKALSQTKTPLPTI